MKSIAKVLLVGAVAVMAIAVSAAPSEAKKKKMKGPASRHLRRASCLLEHGGKVMVWGAGHEVVAGDAHAGLRLAGLPGGLLSLDRPTL